jgi:hypothetical protein
MIAVLAVLVLVLAVVVGDIRRDGGWDPWDEFDERVEEWRDAW